MAGQTVEVFGASGPRVVPAKPKSQRNSESLVGVVGATILFGGLAWVIGGWAWALGIGLIVLAVGMKARSGARNEWRRMTESTPGTIWVREYQDAKAYQRSADLMGGFGWELRQQSQGGAAGGAIGGVGFGPLFAGTLKLKQGKILVTWIRGEPKNRCQFCTEPINPAARVCPHCGREVVVLDVSSEARPNVKAAALTASPSPAGRRTWHRGDQLELEHAVDLRHEPSAAGRPFAAIATGAASTVLDVRAEWLFLQSEDGTEGWARLN